MVPCCLLNYIQGLQFNIEGSTQHILKPYFQPFLFHYFLILKTVLRDCCILNIPIFFCFCLFAHSWLLGWNSIYSLSSVKMLLFQDTHNSNFLHEVSLYPSKRFYHVFLDAVMCYFPLSLSSTVFIYMQCIYIHTYTHIHINICAINLRIM